MHKSTTRVKVSHELKYHISKTTNGVKVPHE